MGPAGSMRIFTIAEGLEPGKSGGRSRDRKGWAGGGRLEAAWREGRFKLTVLPLPSGAKTKGFAITLSNLAVVIAIFGCAGPMAWGQRRVIDVHTHVSPFPDIRPVFLKAPSGERSRSWI